MASDRNEGFRDATMAEGVDSGRYFVTGAAGFIGSHLVERLVAEGHQVTGYDNLSSGRREWLASVIDHPRFTFVDADLLDAAAVSNAMQGHDTVFHLAANGDIRAAVENPRLDLEQGVLATFNVLEAVREAGVRRLVFTSSGSVFGAASVVPTPETIGPLLPMSMYAASKLACEALISAAAHTFGFRAWIFRFGNVVGGRMNRGVIYDFIRKLKKDPAELEILGDGEQRKSYILADEVIDAMLFALGAADLAPSDIFHLSCAQPITVTELAHVVKAEMGLEDVRFRFTGGDGGWKGDQPVAVFDVSKLRTLGWEAQHNSEEAVRIAAQRLLQPEPDMASLQSVDGYQLHDLAK